MTTHKKERKVKAWAVYHIKLDDISDKCFATREKARAYLRENAYHSNPAVMKEVIKSYKVIRILITYHL